MAKATIAKDSKALAEVAGNVFSGLIGVFILIVLVVFPLYFQNYYFDILKAKYKFYWVVCVVLIALCLIVGLTFLFIDKMEYGGANLRRLLGKCKLVELKKQPLTYKLLVLFWMLALLSTVLSDYKFESFWGNEGRFSGFFLITLYVVGVFLIGKLSLVKQWYLDLFMLSGAMVCLYGITDYFYMDILGWKSNVESTQLDIFTSTIGNINTYTAFVALVMSCACGLFITERKLIRKLWYYLVVVISFFAIIMGQSDNAYLAVGALFALLPFFLFASRKGFLQYSILITSFISVIKVIDEINKKMGDKVIGISGLFNMIEEFKGIEILVFVLWGLVLALFMWNRKFTATGKAEQIGKLPRAIWSGILVMVAVTIFYLLYDANFGGNPEKYASLSQYLIFNDNWGTLRGYCWRIAWEAYRSQPFIHQLFGSGPDTFGILTYGYREEALALYHMYFESAHNEYLQYLVTMGPFALIAYLLFLGSACRDMVKCYKKKPMVLALLLAVACYSAQALVNINLPIATPVMWCLLAVGLSVCREAKEQ